MSKIWHQEWDSGFLNGILDGILGFWKLSSQISELILIPERNSTSSPSGRGRPERRPLPRVGSFGGLEDTKTRTGGQA
jgi:hypothetical protein